MQWNHSILNRLIAPSITEFKTAEIPDLTSRFPEAAYWPVNHFLNSALRSAFKDGWRQVVLGYIRRSHCAFHYYHEARARTIGYLDSNQPDNPRIGLYYDAVTSWENFTLQVSMALDLFKWLNHGVGAFSKNDGSKEQRLYTIANHVKHTASAVESGQCSASNSVPLWLSNDGLQSFDCAVSYGEASEVLDALSLLASDYQDPHSLREKWVLESRLDGIKNVDAPRL